MDKSILFAQLLAIASMNPDGFTVDAATLQPVTTGYAVAVAATQNSFGENGLNNVIDYVTNNDEINAFGGWLNNDNNAFYFDATIIVSDLAKAIDLAKANNQIAIFHLDTLTEIRVK